MGWDLYPLPTNGDVTHCPNIHQQTGNPPGAGFAEFPNSTYGL